MKKQILITLIIISSGLRMNAQWNGTNPSPLWTNNFVGIGTQTPSKSLSIEGSSNSNIGLSISNTANQGLLFLLNTKHEYIVSDQRNAGVLESYNDLILSAAVNLSNPTPSIKFQTGRDGYEGHTRMTIDNIGRVGIGTTTPSLKMVVAQDITNNQDVYAAQFGIMGSTDNRKRLVMGYDTNGDGFGFIKSGFYGVKWTNLVLQPESNGGNVGIGTTTPTYKLDVYGTIRAKEIKVDLLGTSVPDFVFEKDYKLMNLNDLEKFVTTKQHLPEIASEKEMIENGLNMKDFQMKLLQKMEEMTLYIIDQNKKNEKQEQKIKILETEIKKIKSTKR